MAPLNNEENIQVEENTAVDQTNQQETAGEEVQLTREEKISKAADLFATGKRDYLTDAFEDAADKLSEVVSYLVDVYGEHAVECYNAYLYYGKSLLECGRQEAALIGSTMKGMPKDTAENENANDSVVESTEKLTDAEKQEIKEHVEQALVENAEALEEAVETKDEASTEETAKPEEATEKREDSKAEEVNEEMKEAVSSETPETTEDGKADDNEQVETAQDEAEGEGAEDSEDEEEGESSLQRAWEILEVARAICDQQDKSKEWDLNKAEVLLVLGDCSICDENYKQALDDLTVCLELQKEHLAATDRLIAETHFMIARAHKLNDDFENAGKSFEQTKEVLTARLGELEKANAESADPEKEKEIAQLNELVADINIKIEDSSESLKAVNEKMDLVRTQLGLSTAPAPAKLTEMTSEPAKDISNLVRKTTKRQAEPEEATDDSKKPRTEDAVAAEPAEATA